MILNIQIRFIFNAFGTSHGPKRLNTHNDNNVWNKIYKRLNFRVELSLSEKWLNYNNFLMFWLLLLTTKFTNQWLEFVIQHSLDYKSNKWITKFVSNLLCYQLGEISSVFCRLRSDFVLKRSSFVVFLRSSIN